MSKDWSFNYEDVDVPSVPEPLGYSAGSQDMISSKAKRREVIEMKQNRARDITMAQAKGIFMTFISSFFIGRNLSLFTIFIYGYQLYNSLSNIINVNKAFKMFESPEINLLGYKILYVILTSVSFGILLYKVYGMGLIPLNAADWVGMVDIIYPKKNIISFN
ncbi:MAG: ER membrane protein complex subunit 4 [archaeon]|nr:ER membrane protein complex subunit 4 [archaeon]